MTNNFYIQYFFWSSQLRNGVDILITILQMSSLNSEDEGREQTTGQKAGPVKNCLPIKRHGLEGGIQYISREGDKEEG